LKGFKRNTFSTANITAAVTSSAKNEMVSHFMF
jgi:hypothetical protein